jgi:hypothetical protein
MKSASCPIRPRPYAGGNGTPENTRPMTFNILIVAQAGRLQYEAVLFAASLRANAPGWTGQLVVAEPQQGGAWPKDPAMDSPAARVALVELGATIVPFTARHFGASYPYGNKIEALACLPAGAPFVFFDTDTLITGPIDDIAFDFARPSASLRREGTWPEIELYGPGYAQIWGALYDRFGLDFASSLDLSQPDEYWQRYLYFNAGWFFGADPAVFGQRFLEYALSIRDDPPEALVCQSLDPWLDQVALPLVIHSLSGGRDSAAHGALDGTHACHYRLMPLLFAREDNAVVTALHAVAGQNRIKKVLKEYEPFKRMIYQPKGAKVRALFDRDNLPRKEQQLRNQIKRANLWVR